MVTELSEPDAALREAVRETAAITGDTPEDLARRAAGLDLLRAPDDEG
jgi:hypothetical protein